jgi:hypothetical protein
MQRAAAGAAAALVSVAVLSVPTTTQADNVMMNGGYLASDPLTGAHVRAADHRGEFIEVYSANISTRYSEVYVVRATVFLSALVASVACTLSFASPA